MFGGKTNCWFISLTRTVQVRQPLRLFSRAAPLFTQFSVQASALLLALCAALWTNGLQYINPSLVVFSEYRLSPLLHQVDFIAVFAAGLLFKLFQSLQYLIMARPCALQHLRRNMHLGEIAVHCEGYFEHHNR